MAEMWSKVPPDHDGWFWRRRNDGTAYVAEVSLTISGVWFRDGGIWWPDDKPGEFGPECVLPIAPPVECFGILWDDGTIGIEGDSPFSGAIANGKSVRGYFAPTETVQ